jgi:hypothetical protein
VVLPHPKLDHAKARFVPFLTGSSFTRFYYVHALPEHVSADESNAFNAVQEAFMIRLCKLSREEARDLYYPGPWCGMATEAAHGHISKKQISTLRDGSSSFTDREIRRGYTTELAR